MIMQMFFFEIIIFVLMEKTSNVRKMYGVISPNVTEKNAFRLYK